MPWFWPIGTAEYNALLRVARGFLDEPFGIANTLGADQYALGIQAREQVAETFAFLSDEVL